MNPLGGSVVSHPETNFNHQNVKQPFPPELINKEGLKIDSFPSRNQRPDSEQAGPAWVGCCRAASAAVAACNTHAPRLPPKIFTMPCPKPHM